MNFSQLFWVNIFFVLRFQFDQLSLQQGKWKILHIAEKWNNSKSHLRFWLFFLTWKHYRDQLYFLLFPNLEYSCKVLFLGFSQSGSLSTGEFQSPAHCLRWMGIKSLCNTSILYMIINSVVLMYRTLLPYWEALDLSWAYLYLPTLGWCSRDKNIFHTPLFRTCK